MGLFNANYSHRPITRSTVKNSMKKFTESGHDKHIPNAGRPKIEENAKFGCFIKRRV